MLLGKNAFNQDIYNWLVSIRSKERILMIKPRSSPYIEHKKGIVINEKNINYCRSRC